MDIVLTFATSLLITMIAYRYALSRGVMDILNSRSSHTRPTPRGGGISFVITYSAYLFVSGLRNTVDLHLVIALVGGGLMISTVGWLDDRHGLSAMSRLVVHLAASAWAMYWVRPIKLDIGVFMFRNGFLVCGLGVLVIAWLTNLFNFMDGIDGIASLEAISCGLAVWMLARNGSGPMVASLGLALASSVLGFLPMNWSPARIFMGDVGSGYLGFILGTLTIASEGLGGPPAWVWVILLGVFVTDATLTLVRRIVQGKPWHEAHRSHVYQLAVQAGYSHGLVTTSVLGVNVCLAVVCLLVLNARNAAIPVLMPFLILMRAHTLLYRRWSGRQTSPSSVHRRSAKHAE